MSHFYTPLYCEENIWHFAQARGNERGQGQEQGAAVFISNGARTVACFNQKRCEAQDVPVVWDYHVVWLETGPEPQRAQIWDFDSRLPFGTPAEHYLDVTFPEVAPEYAPMFRVVPRAVFLANLASDRRHMLLPDGTYAAPPPTWPCIGVGSTLERFIDMRAEGEGTVLALAALRQRVGCGP
jgi:protein N-terminal glutamine amidohydrolase